MAKSKSQRKTQTVFYWLSLATAALTIVMLFFNWFSFQVASFGPNHPIMQSPSYKMDYDDPMLPSYNLATQRYALTELEDLVQIASGYVEMEGGDWVSSVAPIGMYVTIAVQVLYILVALITIRGNTPRLFIYAAGGVSGLMGLATLVVYAAFSRHIAAHQIDELVVIEFLAGVFPYLLVMLGVGTVVFALLNRQESRALYAVKNPREFVFPPANPETV